MPKQWGQFTTLKEARAAAREKAGVYRTIDIYQNYDGSYSFKEEKHKKAVFICAVDGSGRRYKKVKKENWRGEKVECYEPIKKENG